MVTVPLRPHCQAKLPEIAGADCPLGLLLDPAECGQQQRHEDGNDRHDHQQFDEGEGSILLAFGFHRLSSHCLKCSIIVNLPPCNYSGLTRL